MRFKFKLGEDDAAKYSHGGDWFTFDPAHLDRKTSRELLKLEMALDGNKITQIVADLNSGGQLGLLGGMYLARRLAGVNERWEHFDPMPFAAEVELLDGDGDQGDDDEALDADPTGPVASPSPTTSTASTPTSSTKRTSPRTKSGA